MITAFISSFILVFLKVFQQKNVIHDLYLSAFFTSFLVAVGEVGVIISGATYGWDAVLPIGAGGGVAVILSMTLHKKIFKK